MTERDRIDTLVERWRAKRPDLDVEPLAIWGRLTQISEVFLGLVGRVLRQHELTYNEFQTLAAILVAGEPYELSPNRIAQHNLLSSGGMTNLLNKMTASGLVVRRPAEQDRRGVLVRMTDLGLERLDAALLEENRLERDLIGSLTNEEAQMLVILLRKLHASLPNDADEGSA